jgi:hypothetical protein
MIAHIEAQGSLLRMRITGRQNNGAKGGGRRGIIRVFSRGSRLRLMRFMARLKTRKIRASFITLTFTEIVSNARAKTVFKRFAMRLRRAYPMASAVWRMEFQERGAIHFHLLCFKLPFWAQRELQKTWEACTEESTSIAHIKLVHGARSIMSYIAKYIAKVDDRDPTSLEDDTYQHGEGGDRRSGRFWGYHNKELLPLGEVVAGVLTDRQTIKSLSSFAWSLLKSDNPYNSLSFHLFCENARWLCERAIEEGGALYSEWEYTVKDHSTPKDCYHPYTERFSERELEIIQRPSFGRMSRPSEASTLQPRTWIEKGVRISSFAARMLSDFQEQGTIVHIVPLSKGQKHGAV